ncbi:MAG: hypothetical protein ACKOJF_28640 [Planctomycetaceae bacterium]
MSTVQIDKLLQTVVNHKASDLHITTGQPPVVRAGGRMVKLETKSPLSLRSAPPGSARPPA